MYESLRDALQHATALTSALMELCERFPDVQQWKQWRDQAIALQRDVRGQCEGAHEAMLDALIRS